ncbi:hypothetical protein HGR00_09840 [Ralstonia insidiosa]|uniref:Uncharacterized protein n=1 Tax=Ralstonia insidiosa TaxID=190721 RepID=A0A848P3I4_9RALS|nr:NAD(P)H-dependent oxidoreductase [Ralstonia insidiosa]NMV38208.1 hypothetical protein [Ralstonia insidiosa]
MDRVFKGRGSRPDVANPTRPARSLRPGVLLAGINKRLVILSSRGDFGYGPGQRIAHMNHVEGGVATAFGYIGITDVASVAIEYDEFADDRLRASIASAEADVDALAARMATSAIVEAA